MGNEGTSRFVWAINNPGRCMVCKAEIPLHDLRCWPHQYEYLKVLARERLKDFNDPLRGPR